MKMGIQLKLLMFAMAVVLVLAAESNDVSKVVTCTIDGKDVTIVEMGWMGFLPSGPTMLVFDVDGKLIDKTGDVGDDSRFQQKWIGPWGLVLKEKALRWLRETRLPEVHCAAPNTMADFAASNRQTYRDAQGRNMGSASTYSSGRTTYRDSMGRLQGTKK